VQNFEAEDVLGLSPQQIVVVVRYVLSEARAADSLDESFRRISSRMAVLRACCRRKPGLIGAIVDYLVLQIAEKRRVLCVDL